MAHYTTLVQRCRQTNSLLADEIDQEFRRLESGNEEIGARHDGDGRTVHRRHGPQECPH